MKQGQIEFALFPFQRMAHAHAIRWGMQCKNTHSKLVQKFIGHKEVESWVDGEVKSLHENASCTNFKQCQHSRHIGLCIQSVPSYGAVDMVREHEGIQNPAL